MASPWQTSIIVKLMGKQLGYRALQTRLAGIWRPSGMDHGLWEINTSMFKHGRLIFILEQPRSHPLQFGFDWNTYPLNTITMNF
ncbi:hypothetical protein CFP56_042227 [Quercus suber]|uniref:DUF4283 domain-containing protein n=1 Tax=Quercus suber TaxID=58331 RepID=A0AAW0MBQ1_QUESU